MSPLVLILLVILLCGGLGGGYTLGGWGTSYGYAPGGIGLVLLIVVLVLLFR